jgi:WXG100 family type VII secretion target
MADLAVSSDAVHGASADVAGYLAEFEARLRQTAAKVSAVVGSDWSGGAAKEFHAGWVEWTHGAAEIHTALAGISRLLSEAAVSYETTETDVKTAATGSAPTVAPVTR